MTDFAARHIGPDEAAQQHMLTSLGYSSLDELIRAALPSGAEHVITFGASPGPGSYVVHADAVAEVGSTNSIYRARKQTADPLVIQPPE